MSGALDMTALDVHDLMRRLLRLKRENGEWNGAESSGTELIWNAGLFTASEIIECAPDAIRAETEPACS